MQKGLDRNWSSGFERISRLIENRVSCAPSRRPAHARKYREYRITADDPKALAKPYTYTRYFQRSTTELKEDFCENRR